MCVKYKKKKGKTNCLYEAQCKNKPGNAKVKVAAKHMASCKINCKKTLTEKPEKKKKKKNPINSYTEKYIISTYIDNYVTFLIF